MREIGGHILGFGKMKNGDHEVLLAAVMRGATTAAIAIATVTPAHGLIHHMKDRHIRKLAMS